ncbi:DUF441 domain-containing protein [Paenibacillus terrigena]|uniref:DUF441 domain-containing protein n=1 Tax=Paenibacillus terrigena TaxID=369333 RepID=UPI0028CFF1FD|nr:DUF441 domain-containing protein [Paenibacillus terrigena]
MNGEIIMVVLIIIGLISRSSIITTAACLLLIVKLVHLDRYLPTIERRGLELGLLFLTMGVLVPFVSGRIATKDVWATITSWPGLVAIAGGAIATIMNAKGLETLKIDPQIIVGLVLGSIIGITFFKGIPVGPLMAAGLTALIMKIIQLILNRIL